MLGKYDSYTVVGLKATGAIKYANKSERILHSEIKDTFCFVCTTEPFLSNPITKLKGSKVISFHPLSVS